MKSRWTSALAVAAAGLVVGVAPSRPARAEIVDEIVAKVNEDIVTKSDLDAEEQGALEDAYKRYSGAELDRQVQRIKRDLLRSVIDRKVLLQRAPHLFDMSKMQDFFLQQFKDQQKIASDKELEKLLTQEGITIGDWKKKLVEYFAPQQVLRSEVVDRVAVSEKDARAYYDAHSAEYQVPAEATVREIVLKAGAFDRDAKRAAAEAIQAKAAAPEADFAAIANESSEAGTKKNGGLLGSVKKGDLDPSLEQVAFTIPVGSVSPVVENSSGFHILKIDAREDDHVKPFDAVRGEIESKLQDEQIQKETRVYLKKLWGETTIWIAPSYQARLSPAEATP